LDRILGGYILSYIVAEMDFFKKVHGRFMKLLGTWINMLLCDKCIMTMQSDY
jgi:hypothetical protein